MLAVAKRLEGIEGQTEAVGVELTVISQWGGGGAWHKASVFGCLPLAAPIGLLPLLIQTLCGPERVLVVSTEPPDDLSCLTTPGSPVGGGGGLAQGLGIRLFAFGGAYWPLATAHSDPLWARTCFGCVNGAPG